MEEKIRTIIWSKRAEKQLLQIFQYIVKDSYQNAVKVVDSIEQKVTSLSQKPELHPPDKYKFMNDGSYRSFTKYKYRVVYKICDSTIRIIRIRHTMMSPKYY